MKFLDLFLGTGARSVAGTLTSLGIAATLLTAPGVSFSDDLNVAASNCSAPFLDQAFPMRWHQNYLMNPSSNGATYVICPLSFDNDILPPLFDIGVIGSWMSGASSTAPSCFFTANAAFNTTQSPFRSGNNAIYKKFMPLAFLDSDDVWVAEAVISAADIAAAIGPSPNFWVASVFCNLSQGFSISGILASNDL